MRDRSIIDDIEAVMREREWLPWYERYGFNFMDVMAGFPVERRTPPEDWREAAIAIGPGKIYVNSNA